MPYIGILILIGMILSQSIPSGRHSWQETTPWKTIKHSKTSSAKSSPLKGKCNLKVYFEKITLWGCMYFLLGSAGLPRRKNHDIVCVFRPMNVHSTMRTLAVWRFVSLDGSTGIFRRTADHP